MEKSIASVLVLVLVSAIASVSETTGLSCYFFANIRISQKVKELLTVILM